MQTRMKIEQALPRAWKLMYGLETFLATTPVSNKHKELIRIRSSQINGCGFCINMHTKEALKSGESAERIFLLSVWRESELFTKEEQMVLELTECITLISEQGVPDSVYARAKELFDETYIAGLIMSIITINSWNRIAVSTRLKF